MKIFCANRIAPDGTPRSAASHLGLFCLPMSHKRDSRLKLVKIFHIHVDSSYTHSELHMYFYYFIAQFLYQKYLLNVGTVSIYFTLVSSFTEL